MASPAGDFMTSVIIVNWNSGPLLQRCVRSLWRHAPGSRITVIDNASTDGSLDFEIPAGQVMDLQRMNRNRGFAAGCNAGWQMSDDECVLFLNPDTEALAGSVQALEETLRDPSIWAAGGSLFSSDGRHQSGFNVRSFPTVAAVASDMLLLDELWPRNPWVRRYRMLDWDHLSLSDVDQPAAACLAVRRGALEKLGGFDEGFQPAWFEDVDLCRRIHGAGGRIVFQPAARFVHHGGSSLGFLGQKAFLESFHANQIRYFAKHHGAGRAAAVRRLVAAGMALRALLVLFVSKRRRRAGSRTYWSLARRFFRRRGFPA